MIDTATALSIAGIIIGVGTSWYFAHHFYKKAQKQNKRKPSRRRSTRQDQLSVNLDLTKPDLGLTDEKIKRIGLAWLLNKLIDDNRNHDAI